jgi:ATP-dependent Lon protease
MYSAITSLLTGTCVRPDVAMTGEITLRGLVLPVGGIKEKMLAAHRAGIKRIVLPERNKKDVVDVPEEIRQEIEICYVKNVDEAAEYVFDRSIPAIKPEGTVKPEDAPAAPADATPAEPSPA